MGEHVLLHVPGPPELFVADLALVVPAHIVHLGQVILVVGLVIELGLTSLASVGLDHPLAHLGVSLQVAVADELFFAVLTLEPLPLGEWDVFLEMSHDLKEK